MNKREIIERLKRIAGHAVHIVGEQPFVMSLDDGIAVHEAIELLEKPERKKGKWIDKSGGIEDAWNYCSICGEQAIDLYDFCPNCGADMRQPATHCTDDYCEREKKPQDGFTKWAKSVADSYRNDKEESE